LNGEAVSRTVLITNRRGLHARASAKFVTLASGLNATIMVRKEGYDQEVVGTSIMGLMMLGAAMGDSITISADGDGAEQALAAMAELVEDRFGEE
jgi:phosphocarrier protein HPr